MSGADVLIEEQGGRPTLRWSDRNRAGQPPTLSLSYCEGWVGVALVARGKLGLDIEPVGSVSTRAARRVMSDVDAALFDRVSKRECRDASTRYWTRAEAVAKAAGSGLQLMLSRRLTIGFRGTGAWAGIRVVATNLPLGITVALAAEAPERLADATASPIVLAA